MGLNIVLTGLTATLLQSMVDVMHVDASYFILLHRHFSFPKSQPCSWCCSQTVLCGLAKRFTVIKHLHSSSDEFCVITSPVLRVRHRMSTPLDFLCCAPLTASTDYKLVLESLRFFLSPFTNSFLTLWIVELFERAYFLGN